MNSLSPSLPGNPSRPVRFRLVLAGVSAFLAWEFIAAIIHMSAGRSGGMANKFAALAMESHRGFLIAENLRLLPAYALVAIAGALIIHPAVHLWTARSTRSARRWILLRSIALAFLVHGYCKLRLIDTRPYFLHEIDYGHWYYRILEVIPTAAQPAAFFTLFTALPVLVIFAALFWHLHRFALRFQRPRLISSTLCGGVLLLILTPGIPAGISKNQTPASETPNILIIGSDSLRGDRIGASGYLPQRSDGHAAAGVSPTIDALAARSVRFERCYTPIASTLESGISVMASQYPQTHGIRQMYPERDRVEKIRKSTTTLADLLRKRGYDTAAIGDWCAGYYEVTPLGFEHISVSSFDNFRIYMSQAVTMAHFVIPLYFDNPLGYRMFPKLGSFAQFVTPEVVTSRVEDRLAKVSRTRKPFFWHVFYSSNHLPYRSPEPYRSLFADPNYKGKNRAGVDFDIDAFIGSTDLEDKWQALPPEEVAQIRALYDGCTRQFDDSVARILAALRREGLEKNTIVIITADHGDDLYEPGVTLGHGLTLNGGSQANHVPLIIHVPGETAGVIPEAVRTIDVMPTLADFLGLEKPASWQGRSLAAWITGRETPEWLPFYGETGFPFIQFRVPGVDRPEFPPMDEMTRIEADFNYQFVLKPEFREPLIAAKQRCLHTRYWKLVCTPDASGSRHFGLFHLPGDPHCQQNIAAERPEILAPMKAALETFIDQNIESSISTIFPAGEPAE